MENMEEGEKTGLIRKQVDQTVQTHQASKSRKGGLRTMPFIIVNESFEKVASYGLAPNMIFYVKDGYHLQTAAATSTLFLWSAFSNALAIVGAFLADSYLGRFRVIIIGSFSSLLGMTILWLTAMIPQLKPPSCLPSETACGTTASPAQLGAFFFSLALMSIGAGCIRPCSIAFGADQFDKKENPNNERILDSFFNWYYATIGISTVLALTVIVYIQDNFGWKIGFGVPVLLMVFSVLMFLVGSSLYVKFKPANSLFTGFIQVLVVAFKNRRINLRQSNFDQHYHGQDSKLPAPTHNFRCLNKACIIRDTERDLNPDGSVSNPWNLCTVDQVESLKSLLRVLPMWSTGIIMLLCLNQNSFGSLQAKSMDRKIFGDFKIPAGSFTLFLVISVTIWVAFYDQIMVPLLARYTGQPRGLSPKLRMGIGLVLTSLAMAVSAVVEAKRRQIAIEEGLEDKPNAVIDMSAMWLVPQFVLLGFAEGLNAIGQIEFFYSQFPKSMSSIAVALYTLEMAVANLLGSILVDIVNGTTSGGGKLSWLDNNLNQGHLDYYYWLCCGFSMFNVFYFGVCCWGYGSFEERKAYASDEVEEVEYRDLPSS